MAASTSNSPIDAELYRLLVTGEATNVTTANTSEQVGVLELRYASDINVVLDLRCASDNNNVLHIAASSGQVVLVNEILRHWPDLMYKENSDGDLPFHSAIKAGKLESVNALIGWIRGANTTDRVLSWINRRGNTALHIAMEYDDELGIARELVDLYPPALYAINNDGIRPLYMAIKKELVDLVRHMVEKLQASRDDAITDQLVVEGQSVLHAAVSAQNTEMLKHLLIYDDGKLIKTVDKDGWTALSYAACMGYLDKVEIFEEKVPDGPFMCNRDGSFPIHQAVIGGHVSVVNLLSRSRFVLNAGGQNIIHLATMTDDSQLLSRLLDLPDGNSLINKKDEVGNTPLHLATKAKYVEVVETLINNKDINVKLSNIDGLTAYDLAMKLKLEEQDTDVVHRLEFMLERANNDHKTCELDDEMYGLLINGDINQVIQKASHNNCKLTDLVCLEDRNNVLHIAACIGNTQIIQDLLDRHNCTTLMYQANKTGDLPIHSAVKATMLQSLKSLFQWSSTIPPDVICQRANIDGNTTLHIALLNNHGESANYLYEKCPQAAYCLNKENICPLYLAIKNGENELINNMIQGLEGNTELQNHLKYASVVHLTIRKRNEAILKSIINKAPDLLDSLDKHGQSPLSYAARRGYVEGVKLLLQKYPNLEFKHDKDKNGSFPIHQAVKGNCVKVIELFRPMRLLNNKGQNILHVAADYDSDNIMKYLLRRNYKKLINTTDDNGNTPLHLAVNGFNLKVVFQLMNDQHTNRNVMNEELLTPLDMFMIHKTYPDEKGLSSLQIHLMELMLNIIYGRLLVMPIRRRDNPGFNKKIDKMKAAKLQASKNKYSSTRRSTSKERANIFLVVATLIITVTFAAAFSPPSGYNEQTGVPNLASHKYFRRFVSYNSTALACGIVSAITLILGMNINGFVEISLFWGGYFIFAGLISMIISFGNVLQLYYAKEASHKTGDTVKGTKPTIWYEVFIIFLGPPIFIWACSLFKVTARLYLTLLLPVAMTQWSEGRLKKI